MNEYLCDEEFSILEGFSDDKPVRSNETIQNTKESELIKDKLETKKDLVSLITMISNIFGVILNEKELLSLVFQIPIHEDK